MTTDVGVIDYGAGNIGSILNMLRRVGAHGEVVGTPEQLGRFGSLILPGVGHFDHGVAQLRSSGLFDALAALDVSSTRLLGICLGMQLLMDGSDEGALPGLGLVPGRCVRLEVDPRSSTRKVPHMGWNTVAPVASSRVLAGQPDDSRYYFVHSFHAVPTDQSHVAGMTTYGAEFVSAVDRGDGVAGVQFHPEKSHRYGMALLRAFVDAQ